MGTTFRQQGSVLTHITAGAVAVNEVLALADSIAVALESAAGAGESISVAVEGVHVLPKTAGTAWAQGAALDWDASAGEFFPGIVTPAAGDIVGCAFAAAAALAGATTGLVKLANPGALT